jgi:hypothetical protein
MGFVCSDEGGRSKSTPAWQEHIQLETGCPGRWPELVISEYGLERWRPIVYGRLGATQYPTTDKSTWRDRLLATSRRHCRPVKGTFVYSCYSGSLEVCFSQSESYRPATASLGTAFCPWAEISVCKKWWKLFEGKYGPAVGYYINTPDYILNWNV